MAKLRYTDDPRVKEKVHTAGSVVRTGRVIWMRALTHIPCGGLVHKTQRGLRCEACGIIAPNVDDVIEKD